MQGSPLQDRTGHAGQHIHERTRQWRTVHENAGQNRTFRAAHCMKEQDSGGQCMRMQDRTVHAGQHIA